MDDPTVLDVVPSCTAQLSMVSPGNGTSLPMAAALRASSISCWSCKTWSIAPSISREPHASCAFPAAARNSCVRRIMKILASPTSINNITLPYKK